MTTQTREGLPRIAVVGGDQREAALVELWLKAGGDAQLYGHHPDDGVTPGANFFAHALAVAPPSGIDADGRVRGPFGQVVLAPDVLKQAQGVIAGAVAGPWAAQIGIPCAAYRERPEFAWPNAVPTAEGALGWALTTGPHTLAGSEVLVAGVGRVGTALALRARALGASVVALDRVPAARGRAAASGLAVRPLGRHALTGGRWLFNTIPAQLFDVDEVARLCPDARVLDLASWPGGFTHAAVRWLGPRLTVDRSVPGRVAPISAAKILHDCIRSVWAEWMAGGLVPARG